MKVLMISTDRGLLREGGIGDAVARHMAYAEQAGKLDIIVVGRGPTSHVEFSSHARAYLTQTTKLFHLWGVLNIAEKLLRKQTYDLIVSQDLSAPAAAILKKRYKVPLVIGVHSMFYKKGLFSRNVINQWGVRKIKQSLKSANGFRVNNSEIKEWLRSQGLEQPILVQPTPVDVGKFMVSEKKMNDEPVVLYVGRLSKEKNVDMLIRAFRQLSGRVSLHIVGDGAERNVLEKLSQGDGRIAFLGARSHNELADIYRKADIFVLPSNTESFGKVLLEAAAARCAIIATRTAGATSIFNNEEAIHFIDVGDQKALEEALGRLVGDKDYRVALGKRAHEKARHYSDDTGIERTVQFWREISEKR